MHATSQTPSASADPPHYTTILTPPTTIIEGSMVTRDVDMIPGKQNPPRQSLQQFVSCFLRYYGYTRSTIYFCVSIRWPFTVLPVHFYASIRWRFTVLPDLAHKVFGHLSVEKYLNFGTCRMDWSCFAYEDGVWFLYNDENFEVNR